MYFTRLTLFYLWLVCLHSPASLRAELTVRPTEVQAVLAGGSADLSVQLVNSGTRSTRSVVRGQIVQLASATAVPAGFTEFSTNEIGGLQTVIASTRATFPNVMVPTVFLIQWISDSTNRVLGKSRVVAYPADIAVQLRKLLNAKPMLITDTENLLIPWLKSQKIDFVQQEGMEVPSETEFGIAVVVSNNSDQGRDHLVLVKKLARSKIPLVWFKPVDMRDAPIEPRFYPREIGGRICILSDPNSIAEIETRPVSQLTLLRCCQRALNPVPSLEGETSTETP
jgi:hypothetical protein